MIFGARLETDQNLGDNDCIDLLLVHDTTKQPLKGSIFLEHKTDFMRLVDPTGAVKNDPQDLGVAFTDAAVMMGFTYHDPSELFGRIVDLCESSMRVREYDINEL